MSGGETFPTFFRLGIEHILTGHDHLLFLLGLWVACTQARQLVWIVTSFTLAHSLTLAAATLGWVRLPDGFVEPAIAATIVVVGLENLLQKGEPKGRVLVTFAFGLLHGFGFSNVLRVVLADAGGGIRIVPLLGFNVGVEVGQLFATAIGLPLIWALRRWPPTRHYVVPVTSAIVAAVGIFWFGERLLG